MISVSLDFQGSMSGDAARHGFPLCLHAETGNALFLKETRKYEIRKAMFYCR